MSSPVNTEIRDQIAWITLNANLNPLSYDLSSQLIETLNKVDHDDQVRVIVIQGSDRAFSVGADIRELWSVLSKTYDEDMVYEWIQPWRQVARIEKPIIMALHGYVFGGGFEIALMGDILVASDQAQFAQPEIKLGLIPGCGGTVRLFHQLGYYRAFHMCATGAIMSAATMKDWGVIQEVVPHENLKSHVLKLAQHLVSLSTRTLQSMKGLMKSYYFGDISTFQNALAREYAVFRGCTESKSGQEGMSAFLEKREPHFEDV